MFVIAGSSSTQATSPVASASSIAPRSLNGTTTVVCVGGTGGPMLPRLATTAPSASSVAKVSSTLHTPLMSGANAIHGIILLGAFIVTGTTDSTIALVVGLVAIVLAAVNMIGGFVVTDRMLQMFTRRKKPAKQDAAADGKVA